MSTVKLTKKPKFTKLKRTSQRFGEKDPLAPNVRKKRFEIRFHNHEFVKISQAFLDSGQYQNLAQYIRENILDVADSGKKSASRTEVLQEFSSLQDELRRIGNNVNQIARRVNYGDESNLTRDLKTVLAQISELSVRLLKKCNVIQKTEDGEKKE